MIRSILPGQTALIGAHCLLRVGCRGQGFGFSIASLFAGSLLTASLAMASAPLLGTETIVEPDNPITNSGFTSRFGRSVALDGDVLVVGSLDDVTAGGLQRGAVYVFERIGGVWTQQEKLVAPDGADEDEFGFAVDVALGPPGMDDFLIVGAPEANRISAGPDGKVYLFRRTGVGPWLFETQLTPDPDTEKHSSRFGYDVAIDVSVPANSLTGDPAFTAVVGSPYYERPSTTSENQGAIQIYQLIGSPANWQLTHELYGYRPTGTQSGYMFAGWSVALDGGLIVAGAPYWNAGAQESGVGLLYGRQNQQPGGHFHWVEASRLEATLPTNTFDRLGLTAAISFETFVALLGAPQEDGLGLGSGGVYVFEVMNAGLVRNEVQILRPSDGQAGDRFGTAVDVDGRCAVIGAPGSDVGNLEGAVYLFEQMTDQPNSWVEVGKISPSDLASDYQDVGAAAAISGLTTAYGVTRRSNSSEGAVYLNELGWVYGDGFE